MQQCLKSHYHVKKYPHNLVPELDIRNRRILIQWVVGNHQKCVHGQKISFHSAQKSEIYQVGSSKIKSNTIHISYFGHYLLDYVWGWLKNSEKCAFVVKEWPLPNEGYPILVKPIPQKNCILFRENNLNIFKLF